MSKKLSKKKLRALLKEFTGSNQPTKKVKELPLNQHTFKCPDCGKIRNRVEGCGCWHPAMNR